MLKKLFNDKKFIFIFSFVLELILYYIFEYLFIGGEYIIPDIGIAPVLGLMFGPVGALGQALASLVFELYEGMDVIASLMDFGIMFFISIFSYKLWYNIFKKREINTPKIDSVYNLMKLFFIIFIVSVTYWAAINISLSVYPALSAIYPLPPKINSLSYFLNMFNFSIMFGLLFISLFNILGIPFQISRKWPSLFNIKYRYLILIFFALLFYVIMNFTLNLQNPLLDKCVYIIFIFLAVLGCLNKFNVNIKIVKTNYSIIEEIIIMFLFMMAITVTVTFQNFELITLIHFRMSDKGLLMILASTFVSAIFFLITIAYVNFIEKTVTNPIYELIDAMKEFNTEREVNGVRNSRFRKYLSGDEDISKLIGSFITLNNNIKTNLNQIKETTAENERIETELNVASKIQRDMLRDDFYEFSKDKPFEIYGFMNPAREVGGDFYDYFEIDDENIGFVIGDVSGKGIPATLFMVKTMHLIRTQNKFKKNPKEVFEKVNNLTCDRNDGDLFVTSWFGKLNLKTGKLVFVNAGHNKPLLKIADSNNNTSKNQEKTKPNRNEDNIFEYLDIRPNFVLGGMEGLPYKQNELNLSRGDIIFLYTDGITEANKNYQGFYGEEHLKETINKHKDESLEKIIDEIKNDVYDFCNDEDQFDDMTMLIIRYDGCENNE